MTANESKRLERIGHARPVVLIPCNLVPSEVRELEAQVKRLYIEEYMIISISGVMPAALSNAFAEIGFDLSLSMGRATVIFPSPSHYEILRAAARKVADRREVPE